MNSRYDFDHKKLEGIDVDIETSLKEYGIAWIIDEKETLFYYGICVNKKNEYTRFDFSTLDNNIDPKKEWDWVEWESFLKTAGLKEIKDQPLVFLVNSLISYYGYLEIFGESYWGGLKYEEIVQ